MSENERKCLRDYDAEHCRGEVTARQATTCVIWECEHHMAESVRRNAETEQRYGLNSSVAPAWFDPYAAGEHWDEDY